MNESYHLKIGGAESLSEKILINLFRAQKEREREGGFSKR